MKPALLVIDIQKAFYDINPATAQSLADAVEYTNAAIALFREKGLPVVCIQHVNPEDNLVPGQPGFDLPDTLHILPSDLHIHKTYGNAFNRTARRRAAPPGCRHGHPHRFLRRVLRPVHLPRGRRPRPDPHPAARRPGQRGAQPYPRGGAHQRRHLLRRAEESAGLKPGRIGYNPPHGRGGAPLVRHLDPSGEETPSCLLPPARKSC